MPASESRDHLPRPPLNCSPAEAASAALESILIATEAWQGGGLESHLSGEIRALRRRGVGVHLAVGARFSGPLIQDAHGQDAGCRLTAGLPIAPEMTLGDFTECVEAMRELIRRNQIRLVHAHPYLALIPSLFAAALEGIPLAITVHGPNSVHNSYGPLYDFVLKQLIFPQGTGVIAVSQEIADIVAPFTGPAGAKILPNGVPLQPAPDSVPPLPSGNGAWLLVSRLDEPKARGALDFIGKALIAGFPKIDVAGDGPARPWLQRQVEARGLGAQVSFLGWRDNPRALMAGYAGVAGMGRVILEGIAANRPVFLVGYDGAKGLVDRELLRSAAYANFSGRNLGTIDAAAVGRHYLLVSRLDLDGLRGTVAAEYDEAGLWDQFLRHALDCRPQPKSPFEAVYDALLAEPRQAHQRLLESAWFLGLLQASLGPRRSASGSARKTAAAGSPLCADSVEDSAIAEPAAFRAISHREGGATNGTAPAGGEPAGEGEEEAGHAQPGPAEDPKGSGATADAPRQLSLKALPGLASAASNLVRSFAQVQRDYGFREACSRTRRFLEERWTPGRYFLLSCPGTSAIYQFRSALLRRRLADSRGAPPGGAASSVFPRLWHVAAAHARVALFIIAEPVEWSVRHEAMRQLFAARNYLCIVLCLSERSPYLKENQPSFLETNCVEAVLASCARKSVAVLAATPLAEPVAAALSPALLIYDAIADPLVMPVHCGPMRDDHIRLLRQADVVLFPGENASQAWSQHVSGERFIPQPGIAAGGIQSSGIEGGPPAVEGRSPGEFVVGYCGALNEMVDWELLGDIAEDGRFRLLLIGPVMNPTKLPGGKTLPARAGKVLGSGRVTHVEPRFATSWPHHLKACQAVIVPPVTGSVNDLAGFGKVFDCLSAGVPVLAARSRAMDRLAGIITVGDRAGILRRLADLASSRPPGTAGGKSGQGRVVCDWPRAMEPALAAVQRLSPSARRRGASARVVNIVNMTFYDWDGVIPYRGGAERYVYDLARVLMSDGVDVRIVQAANRPFQNEYHGISVHGVKVDCGYDFEAVSREFRRVCADAGLVIASPVELASELTGKPVIGINHGIHWDHRHTSISGFKAERHQSVFKALKQCRMVVGVDTNFVNWVRTCDYTLSGKVVYIPNYVDRRVFRPTAKHYGGRIRCLYPRRLYEARGLYLTLESFDYLLRRFSCADLHFVGQADSAADAACVREFMRRHGGRVTWEELEMDQMHTAYEASHIVLIPTMYSEGTSLSCLEGMATGNAIVATTVGGLPNLVIDGFNGLLTQPNAVELGRAVERLIDEPERIGKMARAGLDLVAAFDKPQWEERWRKAVREVMAG